MEKKKTKTKKVLLGCFTVFIIFLLVLIGSVLYVMSSIFDDKPAATVIKTPEFGPLQSATEKLLKALGGEDLINDNNIANTNLTLDADRTVTLATRKLSFDNIVLHGATHPTYAGNVGIGTSGAVARLEVFGATDDDSTLGFRVKNSASIELIKLRNVFCICELITTPLFNNPASPFVEEDVRILRASLSI